MAALMELKFSGMFHIWVQMGLDLHLDSANRIWETLIEIETRLLKYESYFDRTKNPEKLFPIQSILPPPHFNTSIKKLSSLT